LKKVNGKKLEAIGARKSRVETGVREIAINSI
jgi:hypothetical protein